MEACRAKNVSWSGTNIQIPMQLLDPSTVLSMQQTADYLTHLDTEVDLAPACLEQEPDFWSNFHLPLLGDCCPNPCMRA